jgi:hypothetical protein
VGVWKEATRATRGEKDTLSLQRVREGEGGGRREGEMDEDRASLDLWCKK